MKKINIAHDVTQYTYRDYLGKIRKTKPNSALSLLLKKYTCEKNGSLIRETTVLGYPIIAEALTTLRNKGQITDFYNELYTIDRHCIRSQSKLHFNESITKVISTYELNVSKGWVNFIVTKPRFHKR